MEFTRLNMSTKSDIADGGWHIVIAPRSVEKSSAQQDHLDRDFCRDLPRAHFLRPGCFHAAAENGTFSPNSHDLCFKGDWLQEQLSWDSKNSAAVAYACTPHPLAKPGFNSPKICRSSQCDPSIEMSMSKYTKNFAHTLPLPHPKIAVFKQSSLSCRPQGFKTSVVEKPQLMRAAISPTLQDSIPIDSSKQKTCDQTFQHVNDQGIQTQGFSSLQQGSLNVTNPELSKKQECPWSHSDQMKSRKKQSFFSMEKWAKDPHVSNNSFIVPQSPHSVEQLNLRRESKLTGYCKLSVYNGTCFSSHTSCSGSNCATSSQSHGKDTASNKKKKNRQDFSKFGNYSIGTSIKRQVKTKSKTVFGQPCVIATLRSGCTTHPVHNTTVEQDLKKLILMDELADPPPETSRGATEHLQGSSPKSSIFSSSDLARCPILRPNSLSLHSDHTVCQPEHRLSNTLMWDQEVRFDHESLNLPNTACKLDWNSVVNAAETYNTQEIPNLLSSESQDVQLGTSPDPHSPHHPHALREAPQDPSLSGVNWDRDPTRPPNSTNDNVFIDFPEQLSHLEAIVTKLSSDLLKEKKDKVALLSEVLKLRMNNLHLKEESLSANAQLHKICQIFKINPETMDSKM